MMGLATRWVMAAAVVGVVAWGGARETGVARGETPRMMPAVVTPGFSGELKLVLWKALVRESGAGANLVLDLTAEEGRWAKVAGISLGYNNGAHWGMVDRAAVTAEGITATVSMKIESDQWVEGGTAQYTIKLTRGKDGKLEGTYSGTYRGMEAEGKVTGEIFGPREVAKGFAGVEPGEHPRLLFRKADLPALKARLETPLGKAYLEKAEAAGDPISLGMLYQLTGDKKYALRAVPQITKWVMQEDMFISDHGRGSGGWGHELVATGIAYDLCYDAWPEDLKKKIDARFAEVLPKLVRYVAVTSHANTHPCSNYYGPGHGAPAIVSLLYANDKGPAPLDAKEMAASAKLVPPPADYAPGEGVPVARLVPGEMPEKWLVAGPVGMRSRPEALGRNTSTKVKADTTVKFGMMVDGRPKISEFGFKALDAGAVGKEGIDLGKVLGETAPVSALFFTALRVEKEAVVMGTPGGEGAALLVSGTVIDDGKVYRLPKGLHTMLVVVSGGEAMEGKLFPRLTTLESREDVKIAFDRDTARVEAERALHAATGLDAVKQDTIETGYWKNYRHWRWGIGDGGFQAETGGYANIASWYPTVYAGVYKTVYGRTPSPHPDVSHLMPRRMMQMVFPKGVTKPRVQKLNSAVGVEPKWISAAWPVVPEAYKPALLWAWNYQAGVEGSGDTGRVIAGNGLEMALAFVRYPLAMEAKHPSEVMPLTWHAETFGFMAFRNGWRGGDDMVSQVFAKASNVNGWNHPNAGTFRIMGLGHEWVVGSTDRVGFRLQEPCVLLPDDETAEGATGRVSYLKTEADGSGVVTVDLGDVYAARKGRMYDGNLLRIAENIVPSGVSGLRAMAFDYSGKSGAPLMFVIVDKIEGGGKRQWLWPLPAGALEKTKVDGNTFTIDYGDAVLKATFVVPGDIALTAATDEVAVGKIGDRHRSFEGRLSRVRAETAGGSFFVVGTVQRKDVPAVKVEGQGLDAVVKVGGREVRFDGGKVVLK